MTDSPPERLFFHASPSIPGTTGDELRIVGAALCDKIDGPVITNTPTPRDVALAIGASSDAWFMDFVTELKRCDIRVAAARAFGSFPAPHDPEFGVDPEDSAHLLELRDTIDRYFGWKSQEDEDVGDYVFRIREIGDMLWNCKAAFIEHHDAELMAKIMLSVTKSAGENLRPHPTINHKFDVAGAASAAHRCSCMAVVHGHAGGVCQAVGAEWYEEPGWPDSLMLCPLCIKHPADVEIEQLRARAAHTDELLAKNQRQRKELRRLNRDERLRQQERARAELNTMQPISLAALLQIGPPK